MMQSILIGLLFAQAAVISAQTGASSSNGTDPSPFASITPSDSLNWVPCPNAFLSSAIASNTSIGRAGARLECARLTAPLDWNNPNGTEKVIIAAIRLPATDKENYKGPIFLNFGGPGVSGTVSVAVSGHVLQDQLGAGYDIVSWDPRAVGSTLPALSCYPNEESRAKSSLIYRRVAFDANNTVVRANAEYEAIARGCEKFSGNILPYLGTMGTVHDLHRLVEIYGYSKKVSYRGGSYGSVLGATYAALWPNQIERMILDGIADPTVYYSNALAVESYSDMDAGLEEFFRLCSLAGPSRCRFWQPTQEKVREAFWALDDQIHSSPVVLPSLEVLDWSAWRIAAISALYTPLLTFSGKSGLADIAAAASGLNFSEAANLTLPTLDVSTGRSLWLTDPTTGFKNGDESLLAIRCLDHPIPSLDTLKELEDFFQSEAVQKLGRLGQSAATLVSTFCGRLNTKSAERFNGTFADVKTSAPVLFVSSQIDPVTPLRNAVNTMKGFRNSGLVTLNATGHTSGSSPSTCIDEQLRCYLQKGTVPANGTVCQPEILPFGLLPDGTLANETVFELALLKLSGLL